MTSPSVAAFVAGFGLGAGLIVAIGGQNAFVLRQGLRRAHVFPVALMCSVSDTALIWSGTLAASYATEKLATFATFARVCGAAFLIVYAALSAWRAFWPNRLEATGAADENLTRTLIICAGLTLLNPHVYLDTCVMIGTIASQYAPTSRPVFALGASSASFVWFFGLGYGARLLSPIFALPLAWRVLDAAIAVVMLALGVTVGLGM